jgi:hypothetical protein
MDIEIVIFFELLKLMAVDLMSFLVGIISYLNYLEWNILAK